MIADSPSRAVLLFVSCLLLLSVVLLPQDVFFSTDESNKFIQVQNLERNHRISLVYPSGNLDPEHRFFPDGGNHFIPIHNNYYSYHPFYFPFLSLVPYKMIGVIGTHLIPFLSTLFLMILLHRILLYFGFDRNAMFLASFVLSTPLLFYTIGFWEHSPALLLSTGSLFLILKSRRSSGKFLLLLCAGFLLGLSTILREEGYIFLVAVVVSLIFSYSPRRAAFAVCVGWLLAMLPVWILQYQLFGNILGLHGVYYDPGPLRLVRSPDLAGLAALAGNFYVYLFEFHSDPIRKLAIALPWLIAVLFGLVLWRQQGSRLRILCLGLIIIGSSYSLLCLLSTDSPLYILLFTQGLFPALPLTGLALVFSGRFLFSMGKDERFLCLSTILYVIAACASLNQARFGLLWGPRIFFPVFPSFAVLSLIAWRALQQEFSAQRHVASVLAIVLLVLSLGIQAFGLFVLQAVLENDHALLTEVASQPESPVVTDVFWIPEKLSFVFLDRQILYVRSDLEFQDLMKLFASKKVKSFTFVASNSFHNLTRQSGAQLAAMAGKRRHILVRGAEYAELLILSCSISTAP